MLFLTNRVGRQMARYVLGGFEFDGFSPQGTHVGLLADLTVRDGQRQQDLAITGVKDKATVARAIVQLLDAGFITRKQDTVDRRQKLIFITDKGQKMWGQVRERMRALTPELVSDVDPEKLSICQEVLTDMYLKLHERTFPVES